MSWTKEKKLMASRKYYHENRERINAARRKGLLKTTNPKRAELHFKRNHASGNWQGDDEHEAWMALTSALAAYQAGRNGK